MGLRSSEGRYLTCETFGDNLTMDSKELRPKQHFTVQQKAGTKECSIKTFQGKYLAGDAKGKLTASSTSVEKNETWTIEWHEDGRWSFKSAHGNYLSWAKGTPNADGRSIAESEKWTGQISIHPQTVIYSCSRKAYWHLVDGEVDADELIPWGSDPLINLTFEDGKYTLQTLNKKFLDQSGSLVDSAADSCKYILEFDEGKIKFKTSNGKYLSAAGGGKGKISGSGASAGLKESFIIEDSHPQFTILTHLGKYFTQTGDALAAKDKEVSDATTFQMELRDKKYAFKCNDGTYLTSASGTLQAGAKSVGATEQFDVEFLGAHIAIKTSAGKYVTCKPNGGLPASGSEAAEDSKFIFTIINRPVICLKNVNGFISMAPGKTLLTCNHLSPYYFTLHCKAGVYSLSTPKGEYWKTTGDGIFTEGDEGSKDEYYLEFIAHTRFAMKHVHSGKYLSVEQKGSFKPNANTPGAKELLEY